MEISKNFTLRYGTPWFATDTKIIPVKKTEQSFFLCRNIKNFEFNSVNKTALIQRGERVLICDNLHQEFKDFVEIDCLVKMAHWSRSNADIIFLLTAEGLLIYNAKKKSFVSENKSIIKLENITNFCVFPKSAAQQHELAVIQDGIIKIIDKVYIEGIYNPSLGTDNEQEFKEEKHVFFSRRTGFVFSKFEIKLSIFDCAQQTPKEDNEIMSTQIIVTDSSHNLFYGTKDGRIFVINDKNITALCSGMETAPIGQIGRFYGFIENQGIFAFSSDTSYLVNAKNVVPFYRAKNIVCASLSPKIISTKDMTIYVSTDSTVRIKFDNSAETLKNCDNIDDLLIQSNSELQKFTSNSFFEHANVAQFRGECLKRRQEQLQQRLYFFNSLLEGVDIDEMVKKYEALYDKAMNLKMLDQKNYNIFRCKIEESRTSFNDTKK